MNNKHSRLFKREDLDDFDENFNRSFNKMSSAIIIGWLICGVVGLGVLGFVIWVIVKIMQHYGII